MGTSRAVYLDPLGKELFPSPTVDPLDPLNWPKWRKYICIAIVMYMYFLFTYSLPLVCCLISDTSRQPPFQVSSYYKTNFRQRTLRLTGLSQCQPSVWLRVRSSGLPLQIFMAVDL
jgi:hypothetical protein